MRVSSTLLIYVNISGLLFVLSKSSIIYSIMNMSLTLYVNPLVSYIIFSWR